MANLSRSVAASFSSLALLSSSVYMATAQTRKYNFFQSLNEIDKIIIIFIHYWLVSMVTEFIK